MDFRSPSDLTNIRGVNDAVAATKTLSRKLSTQDILSIFVVLAVLPISFLFEVTYVLSFWHIPFSEGWLFHVVPLLFLGFNVYTNLYQVARVGPNGRNHSDLPSVTKPGYKYCHSCCLNSPPRAYHCPVCNACTFRRDHHCSFAATCVGHFNQRYFVAGVANLWVITVVCVCWNWNFLWIALPHMGVSQYWQLTLPHIALLFGYLSVFQFVTVACFMSSLTVLSFVTYLLAAQLFTFWRGQTRVEFLLGIHAYNLGFWENLTQSMGRRWPLTFVSAFISSPLPSDGLSFRTRETESVSKDTKYM
jgi:palmitoyltransferase